MNAETELNVIYANCREHNTSFKLFAYFLDVQARGTSLSELYNRFCRKYQDKTVILLDEIEKAHPEVWNSLLQILDDGRLTDGQGRIVNFRNTVLIMTSNLGTEYINKSGTLGFLQSSANKDEREAHDKIEKALKDTFRPEFLNRIDETIVFSSLAQDEIKQIEVVRGPASAVWGANALNGVVHNIPNRTADV